MDVLEAITSRRAVGNDQAQMTDASLLVVMTADVNAWKNDPKRYWVNAPAAVGKGPQKPWPKPGQLPRSEVRIVDRFGG